MKKHLLISAIALGVTMPMLGQQLSMGDKALLRRQKIEQRGGINSADPRKKAPEANAEHKTLAFIAIAPGFSAMDLEKEGVSVGSVRGHIALCSMPTGDVERISSLPCVARLELSRQARATMDKARVASTVAPIHEGKDLEMPYTGKGVLVGIVDQGLDPNHVNFRTDEGTSRLGYLAHIYVDKSSRDGWTGDQYDRNNIWRFTTDAEETFHGTHTLGILAGGYKGNIDAAVKVNTQLAEVQNIANPYYGVAYNADIAASCGDLQDLLIGTGIDRILDYRFSKNLPAVISLSLGSNTGAHHADALMSQFLEMAAKEAIIVLSAGNEGDIPLALIKTLKDDDLSARTFIRPTYQADTRYGQVYFYSDKPFSLQGVIYNKARGTVAYRMPITDAQGKGEPQYYASQKEDETDIVSTQFKNAFSGYCGVGWDIESSTGQYMALMDFYTKDNPDKNATGNYILGFEVTGEAGQRIECYDDGYFTDLWNYDQAGWDNGMTDGSISDMACGRDVLVVGSYNTSDDYPALDGYVYNYQGNFTPGKMTPFSSYGTMADGSTLPHVCAPGAAIISSTSKYYVENKDNMVGQNAVSAILKESDRNNYWAPAMGTSMSTPFVAGSIALWLEADPTLTIDEIKEIVKTTAVRDQEVLSGNPAQWGAGKFDAYAGLKEVVRRNGVGDVALDGQDKTIITQLGDQITAFCGGATEMNATITNLSGAVVLSASCQGDQIVIDTNSLAKGIYVITINGNQSKKLKI